MKKLKVRDRILVHLADFSSFVLDHQLPPQVSQEGIAIAVGIKQRHISQYVRPMIAEGILTERSSYVTGGRQHQKVYFLTAQGRREADWMRDNASTNKSSFTVGHDDPMTNQGTEANAWIARSLRRSVFQKSTARA